MTAPSLCRRHGKYVSLCFKLYVVCCADDRGHLYCSTLDLNPTLDYFICLLTENPARAVQVTGDVGRIAAVLDKPLRPIWLSQESRMWTNAMTEQGSLPFTPLYLVSASNPNPQRLSIGMPYTLIPTVTPLSAFRPINGGRLLVGYAKSAPCFPVLC